MLEETEKVEAARNELEETVRRCLGYDEPWNGSDEIAKSIEALIDAKIKAALADIGG